MDRATFIVRVGALLIAGGTVAGCDRNPFKARVRVNRGSCLQALQVGIDAVRKYAEEHGKFPKVGAKLTELGAFSVPAEVAAMLEYGGSDSLNLQSPERIIVLKCAAPVSSSNGRTEAYCALLSGEILLLPQKDAALGKLSPPGIGRVIVEKP